MVITASGRGFLAAWRQPGLAVLLWVWTLLLSLPLTFPAWTWLMGATARTPEADVLADRFSFAVVSDLLRAESPFTVLVPAFFATILVAIISQALTGGGLIEVLTTDDARPFLHRFFRGAGHFFWRFLRAGIYAYLVCGLAVVIVALGYAPLGRLLENVEWEPASYLGSLARLLIFGFFLLLVTLAFDYARIRMAREDSRRPLRSLFSSLWFVIMHPRATIGLFIVMAIALAAVYSAYGVFRTYVPSGTWPAILLMAAGQQATILMAAWIRVALMGGEIAVWAASGSSARAAVAPPAWPSGESEA